MDNILREALVRFNAVPYVNARYVRTLLAKEGPEGALKLSPRAATAALGCSEEAARRLLETAVAFDADAELAEAERRGIRLIPEGDPAYPASFKDLGDERPLLLYALGDPAPPGPCAAVVGTRSASPYGLRMAKRLGCDLAARGVCVVSGLARGVDTQAHEGALAAKGKTWAFLGAGLGRIYPPENEPLVHRIAEAGGCVAAEFALRTAPDKHRFPLRNRLIAALSFATVVVESRLQTTGAMDTAAQARELGRDVFAVPGPADAAVSQGPLKLLKDGAGLCCGAEDVVAPLGPEALLAARCESRSAQAPAGKAASLPLEYSKILEFLDSDTRTADQLAAHTGLDVPRLSNILFELEIQGAIVPVPGQRYAKKDKTRS